MYIRKTKDIYILQGYYSGWEDLTAEETRQEIKQRYKEYKENEPATPIRIVCKREKINQ